MREQLAGGRELDQAAEIHHADAVRDLRYDGQVVRDEDVGQRKPALQLGHQVEDLRLHRHVQRRGRLVADEQIGLARQRARDRDALALAAGELVGILFAVVGRQPDLREKLRDASTHLRLARKPKHPDRLGDDVAHAPARIQARIRGLEDHLPALAAELDAPVARRIEPDHQARDGRLAATRLADQRQGLAAAHFERHAVYRAQQPPAFAFEHAVEPRARDVEVARDRLSAEQWRSHAASRRPGSLRPASARGASSGSARSAAGSAGGTGSRAGSR